MQLTRPLAIGLGLVLAITAALWLGVAQIGLNSDDYQYIASLAPMHTLSDAVRPFVSPDANPSYFRPLSNMTMVADFLVFGWSGGEYHLTNLFFHLIATALVFFVARNLFGLRPIESLLAALFFGVMASHEFNLAVDTARADVLAAIFVMLAVLAESGRPPASRGVFGLVFFALGLLSKEVGILALPLIFLLVIARARSVRTTVVRAIPYAVVAALFYVYQSQFTSRTSEVLAGAHGPVNLFRNSAYALGYTLLPLDLATATALLSHYRTAAFTIGAIGVALIVAFLLTRGNRELLRASVIPLLFTVITGIVLCLAFERWRVYLPSVGLAAVIVLVVSRIPSRAVRSTLRVLFALLMGWHVFRALTAQAEWVQSTALLERLKQNLTATIEQARPHRIGILASPSKLGSATVLQVGQQALVTRAEADGGSERNVRDGTTTGATLDSWTAVEVFALDASEGFQGLTTRRVSALDYILTVPPDSKMMLFPAAYRPDGSARRDVVLQPGDSIVTDDYIDIVRQVRRGTISSMEVCIRDTTAMLLSFDRSAFDAVP
ncbi:MAG: hypothetical protein Q8922_00695 [Bacteroidota bacterium]|nr:hypothetical protein [Bacteroidota bacterium]MDP4232550.1 hypothetical protein [Bacteroidota bacterium]MDP4242995.1 hypothetical protein [Bacteroidota bacterium]MDP4286430.1 hypothetical protein [Bacteroidota bacterium]